jgi:hypothetical protein
LFKQIEYFCKFTFFIHFWLLSYEGVEKVIARSVATKQSHELPSKQEIATLPTVARNDK